MMRQTIFFAALATLVVAHVVAPSVEADDEIRFNRDIRPILSNNCYTCHGPDEGQRASDLRLDDQESALSDLGEYRAIVPGDIGASELIRRIKSDDPDAHMPPADSNKQLTPQQISLLEKWIQQGAKWEQHWSIVPPEKPEVPGAVQAWGPVNELDQFAHARLQDAQRKPAPDADPRTLLRRLHFDLAGLPPTPQEVAQFQTQVEKEGVDKAIEAAVDRLLESPHFGERMSIWWLDLVRYADSIGYHSDTPRDVWMYRDYVIRSFNENKPFNQFTIEQIAGDLLPDPSPQGRGAGEGSSKTQNLIASGYNRLLQTTEEGGAQAKEYVKKYDADRVRNVSEVWLGATVGCAECHDHKFDPYTQRDFYSMAAFFADINEPGVGKRQSTPMPTPQFEAQLAEFDKQIAAAQEAAKPSGDQLAKAQAKWEAEQRAKLGESTRNDFVWFEDQKRPQGSIEGTWVFINKEQGPVFSGSQSRKQTSGGLIQHFAHQAKDIITLGDGDVFYAYIYLDAKNPPQQVMLQFNDGSWEHRAWWGEDKIPFGGVGTNGANHKKLGPLPKTGEWVRLEVTPDQVGLKPGSKINGMAFTQWGGLAYWDQAGVNRDGLGLRQAVVDALRVEPAQRNDGQKQTLAKHYQTIAPELAAARAKIDQLKRQKEELKKKMPRTLVTQRMNPREIKILNRGNWLDESGEVVQPNTPTFLPPLGVKDRRATRLDLANWLVAKENPMVARAQVNRLWKLFMGHGLARTLDDLGAQGEWPTHPKLLDWMAVEFIDSGWDVKHMVKLIVMSKTYRQSSRANMELRTADPYNRLYARQSRFRLPAEMIRDNTLAIGGLLVNQIGGPSVKPYQPAGYWQHLNFPKRSWQAGSGNDLYRRGLYTHWQRSFLHPSLLAFDATSREECTAQRPISNTPQQALVLLNDPTYVEAARTFAERIMKDGGADDAARMTWAFQEALQRKPTAAEAEILTRLLSKHRDEYNASPNDAGALVTIGARSPAEQIAKAEHAAWTSVARVILNLHETITRQ